jgi:hypothetical protein
MTPLNVNLERLISSIDADLPAADALAKVTEAQQRARSLSDIGDQLIDHFVTLARRDGTPWSQIGDALGVSKQAAQQRWMPPLFQLFTNRARHVVVRAQEQARTLRHGYIGTEHLLLGLLDEPEGAGAVVLENLAGSAETVRSAVIAAVPAGTDNPPAKIPFTRLGKQVLGQSNAEATSLGHNYVGTEHLLLALLKADGGQAAQVLASLDISYDTALAGVRDWIAAEVAGNPDAARRIAAAKARAEARGVRLDVAGDAGAEASS